MSWLLYLLVATTGVLNTLQVGQNNTLAKTSGEPILACVVVALANCAVYAAAIPFAGLSWPSSDTFAAIPWWAWFGGLLGGFYVLAMVFAAGKVGSAVFTGFTVTAAIVTSVLLDHFGLVGFDTHPASLWRIAGAGLMVGGLLLICAF